MKALCTIFLLLYCLVPASQELDSRNSQIQLKTVNSDLEKVIVLRNLMQGYNDLGMVDSARIYLHEIDNILEQTDDLSSKIEALNAFGIYWYESIGVDATEKLANCLRYFNEALELTRSAKDVIREAWVHYYLSICWRLGPFKNMNELDEAQKAMSIALEYPENDSLFIYSCIRTAIAFKWVQNNYEQALRCLDKALVRALETENPIRLRSVYRELSLTYNQANDRIKAGEYIDKMSLITKSHYRPIWAISDFYMKGQMIRNENLEDYDYMALMQGKSRVTPSNRQNWERSTILLEKAYQLLAKSDLGIHWTIHHLHANLFWNYFWLGEPEKIDALRHLDTALSRSWQNKYENRACIFRAAEYYLAGSPSKTIACLDSIKGKFVNDEYHLLYFLATLKTASADRTISVLQNAYSWYRSYGSPKVTKSILLALDSMYRYKQDFVAATKCLKEYIRIGDSLENANSEKVLWALQLSNIEKILQVEREKEWKALNRRYTLQYIGIVIGIITAFCLLAVLGFFHVQRTTIKIMGFFAFLLFFEFIFLLLKKYFNPYTKGEPLKELLVMLVLAGLLIPLHKWVDHQVIRSLTKKRKSVTRGNAKPKVVADSERADIMNRQRTLNPAEAAKYSDNYDVYE